MRYCYHKPCDDSRFLNTKNVGFLKKTTDVLIQTVLRMTEGRCFSGGNYTAWFEKRARVFACVMVFAWRFADTTSTKHWNFKNRDNFESTAESNSHHDQHRGIKFKDTTRLWSSSQNPTIARVGPESNVIESTTHGFVFLHHSYNTVLVDRFVLDRVHGRVPMIISSHQAWHRIWHELISSCLFIFCV